MMHALFGLPDPLTVAFQLLAIYIMIVVADPAYELYRDSEFLPYGKDGPEIEKSEPEWITSADLTSRYRVDENRLIAGTKRKP